MSRCRCRTRCRSPLILSGLPGAPAADVEPSVFIAYEQSAVQITSSSGQSVLSSAILGWTTTVTTAGFSSGVFTAPSAGVWLFQVQTTVTGTVFPCALSAAFRINGLVNLFNLPGLFPLVQNPTTLQFAQALSLATGDVVDFGLAAQPPFTGQTLNLGAFNFFGTRIA